MSPFNVCPMMSMIDRGYNRELNEQIKQLRAKEGRLNAIVRAASFTRHDPDAL